MLLMKFWSKTSLTPLLGLNQLVFLMIYVKTTVKKNRKFSQVKTSKEISFFLGIFYLFSILWFCFLAFFRLAVFFPRSAAGAKRQRREALQARCAVSAKRHRREAPQARSAGGTKRHRWDPRREAPQALQCSITRRGRRPLNAYIYIYIYTPL